MSDIRDAARRHLIPHFTKAEAWQSPQLPVYVRGDGAYLWDDKGRQVLDGLSGLFCVQIGHGRSDLGAVAAKQMETLAFTTNWGVASPPSIEAAELIAELAPGDLEHVFFVSSGSEAVESAAKLARNYHVARGDEGRYKVISRDWAYHGTTLGALSITAVPRLRAPFLPMLWEGVRNVPNTLHGGLERVHTIEEKILEEGPETISMVIAEPVQNGRGALVPPDGYWPELRRICDKYGVLLCADEVINGYGRLGAWFGSELFGVVPDLLTFAKGVTSGVRPPRRRHRDAASGRRDRGLTARQLRARVDVRRPPGGDCGRRRQPDRHARGARDRERRGAAGPPRQPRPWAPRLL